MPTPRLDRRTLLRGAAAGGGLLGLQGLLPAWAQTGSPGLRPDMPTLSGPNIDLTVGHSPFTVGGRTGRAVTMNGVLPAPLLRLREGQNVRLSVANTLDEDTSIHWHGLLVPFQMDGVPGVSFPGIRPRETFVYEFPIRQSGTFWYHSHSGLQEAMGHYGPIIIDPAGADSVAYDREHVLVLSDWSFLHPHKILDKLKKSPGYFNQQRTTLAGLMDGSDRMGLEERRMWGEMRMDPRDILDVTGSTYTYLINGHGPEENWTGLFRPGERVRLRIINAAAMSIFNIRIPGLPMTVVQADGENVRPVETDEFQISVAETYDVIVQHRFIPAFLQDVTALRFRLSNRWRIEAREARPWTGQDRTAFEETRVLDPQPSQKALRRGLAAVRDAFPALEKADVTQSWGGLIDVTPDEIPVISEVQARPGLFVSTGYSGHGFGLGPGAGLDSTVPRATARLGASPRGGAVR